MKITSFEVDENLLQKQFGKYSSMALNAMRTEIYERNFSSFFLSRQKWMESYSRPSSIRALRLFKKRLESHTLFRVQFFFIFEFIVYISVTSPAFPQTIERKNFCKTCRIIFRLGDVFLIPMLKLWQRRLSQRENFNLRKVHRCWYTTLFSPLIFRFSISCTSIPLHLFQFFRFLSHSVWSLVCVSYFGCRSLNSSPRKIPQRF